MKRRISSPHTIYRGNNKNKYSSWVKMLLTVLILTSFFNDIQARFANEMEPFLRDAYKRSPRRFYKFHCPRILKRRFPCIPKGSSSSTSSLCAGISVASCAKQYPQEIKQCKVCGLISTPHRLKLPMIIDGSPVNPPFKYPWMVALIRDDMINCGAAIISDSYILTAAHCLPGSGKGGFALPNEISVAFVTKTHDVELGPPIEKVIPHPEYNAETMRYDFALLKLKQKITCGKYRNPICLPSHDLNINMDTVLRYSGWGTIIGERPFKQPKSLMEGTARLVSFAECKARGKKNLEDVSYCLVGRANARACFGDSGGSMFYLHRKKFYTIGVASQQTCEKCSTDEPFVYAAVPTAVRWIKKTAGL